MLARHLLREKKLFNLPSSYMLRKQSQQATETAAVHNQELLFPPNPEKKPARSPFVKNFFLGKLDTEMLSLREPQPHDRFVQFFAWLRPIENYISSLQRDVETIDKQEILFQLQNLDVFKGPFHENYQGLNLTETEVTKLVETVSAIPWLGRYLVQNNVIPSHILSKHGSDDLKQKYCSKIIEGKFTPTVCLYEEECGTNFRNMKACANRHDNDSWVLNGKKTYVFNGQDSNLFLVFAICNSLEINSHEIDDTMSMFLVERDFGGVTYSSIYDTIGGSSIPMCTVSFDNTIVPKKNIIGKIGTGFDVILKLLAPGHQHVSGQAIGILRNFTNQLISHIIDKKHMDKNLYSLDVTKEVLGKIAYSLYSMESVTYLTKQIADTFENQDTELEQAITDTYCANECLRSLYAGLQVIGKESYLNKYQFMKMYAAALALTTVDTYNVDAVVHIASLGLQYAGEHSADEIYKHRNRAYYPMYAVKYLLALKTNPDLYVKDNLHPSMQNGGDSLEECIHTFSTAALTSLNRHGVDITDRHIELAKLSEMVTQIYVLTACLTRASRSYCIGLPSGDQERNMTVIQSIIITNKLKAIAKDVENGGWVNGEYSYKETADYIYQNHKYPMEHPLNKSY